MTSLAEATNQMVLAGMPDFPAGHPRVNTDGVIRYGPKKAAWYRLYSFATKSGKERIAGAYGMWGKIDSARIEMDWRGIDDNERAELQRKQREAEEREREKRAHDADRAANRAKKQWETAFRIHREPEAWKLAAYLEQKGITPESVRVAVDGTVLVPLILYDAADGSKLIGLQKIMPSGQKRFNKGMAMDGATCRLGAAPVDGAVIVICEGYATGRTIRMAVPEQTVFCCMNADNLRKVADILRARYPSSPILFAADDDWKTEVPPGTPCNVGVVKARAAAHALGRASMVVPVFPDAAAREADWEAKGKKSGWTDFNDLHAVAGIAAVADQVAGAIAALILSAGDFPAEKSAAGAGGGDGGPPDDPSDMDDPPPWEGPPEDWMQGLQRNKNGLKQSLHNTVLYLQHHPAWQGVLGWDLFGEQMLKLRPPPFEGGTVGDWTDMDDARTLLWLSDRMGEPKGDIVPKAALIVARRNEFNRLKDRIESVPWDGTQRLLTWLIEWAHVMKSAKYRGLQSQEEKDRLLRYCELAGMKWLVAAVARVYDPGCRVDNMLIFEGEGGHGKSTLLRIIGGDFFTDARINVNDKDSLLILQGMWIIELPELEGMNKADSSDMKRFMTQHTDLFRPPYGRRLIKVPRRCILGGSVNHDVYLKDDSGNRRFWPIEVGAPIDLEGFAAVVPQLLAEALHLYREGFKWWVAPEEKYLFEEQQEDRYQNDPWEQPIFDYLEGSGDWAEEGGRLEKVTVGQIMEKCLRLAIDRRDAVAQKRTGSALKRLGWVRKRLPKLPDSTGPARQWIYVRGVLQAAPATAPANESGSAPQKGEDDDGDVPF